MSGYGRSTPKFLFCSLLNYLIPLVLLFGTNLSGANQQSPVNGNSLPDNFATLPDDIQAVLLEFLFYSEEAEAVWGKDMESTTRHVMVKYLDEFHTKVRVDFRKGIVQVDTRGAEQPLDALKHAITATLLTPADPAAVDLSTATDFGLTGTPFLMGKVVDHEGQPVQYPWRANRFAEYLVNNRLSQAGNNYSVQVQMVRTHKQISARGYGSFVSESAQRYGLSPALILAIMDTESSFNPFAVSGVGALGLMQVMSRTAGLDVYQKIYRQSGRPGKSVLFDPRSNIDIGSGYLSILRDNYLRGIKNPLSSEYCVIAAYNGGAGNLLKTFHSDRTKAIERINRMSPEDVYRKIVSAHPKKESRNYLKKVVSAKQRYAS